MEGAHKSQSLLSQQQLMKILCTVRWDHINPLVDNAPDSTQTQGISKGTSDLEKVNGKESDPQKYKRSFWQRTLEVEGRKKALSILEPEAVFVL